MPKHKHRGRIQAQGGGVEKSESWAQDEPLSREDGLSLLDRLWKKLSSKEQKDREKEFKKARHYIDNADGGIDAFKGESFRNRKKGDVRVDIEIFAGTAFIVLLLLLIFHIL